MNMPWTALAGSAVSKRSLVGQSAFACFKRRRPRSQQAPTVDHLLSLAPVPKLT